jgi:hypothetical protein
VFDKDGPLSVGDILQVAVSTKNLAENARKLTETGIKQEAYSLLTSSLIRGATNPASSEIGINQVIVNGDNLGQRIEVRGNPINAVFSMIGNGITGRSNVTVATPRNVGGSN